MQKTYRLNYYNKQIVFIPVRNRHQEENMAIVLMGIVSIFLVCNSFRIVLNFYEAVYEIQKSGGDKSIPHIKSSPWFRKASIISNLFVTLNACCNLIIYCALNNQFRNHFFEVIPFCKVPFVSGGLQRGNTESKKTEVETEKMLATGDVSNAPTTQASTGGEGNGICIIEMDEDPTNAMDDKKLHCTNGNSDFVNM